MLADGSPRRADLAIGFVAGHPNRWHVGVQSPAQHLLGELGLDREPDLIADAGFGAALPIVGP
jgi:hypothetical protein